MAPAPKKPPVIPAMLQGDRRKKPRNEPGTKGIDTSMEEMRQKFPPGSYGRRRLDELGGVNGPPRQLPTTPRKNTVTRAPIGRQGPPPLKGPVQIPGVKGISAPKVPAMPKKRLPKPGLGGISRLPKPSAGAF